MPIKSSDQWKPSLLRQAMKDSFLKLNPGTLYRNPVMLVVEGVSILATVLTIASLIAGHNVKLDLQITLWLWFMILFANFAEALAERRGRAQAESLLQARSQAIANRLRDDGTTEQVPGEALRQGDLIMVNADEIIPSDGEVIDGAALVDESAITGESAPVVRESGGSLCGVTGGTRLISGQIKVTITADPGETFLDQMIDMVESARRQKTPNEWALEILLIAMTIILVVVVVTLVPFSGYVGVAISIPVLAALLVCLMPTTIGGLLPAIGIAGMERLLRNNVVSFSGRAIEAAGNVDVVLMDKTGTITLGNRMATEMIPAERTPSVELARAAMLSSLADDTPEGRSIVALAEESLGIHGRDIRPANDSKFIPFSAETRMSGIDMGNRQVRKGASDAIEDYVKSKGGSVPEQLRSVVNDISREGGTALLVVEGTKVLGAIRLKDVIKQGIRERLASLRRVGIRSVMITGDNLMTATAIAAEAGTDDFIGQARPEAKLEAIRNYQKDGHMVAMIGDGTNDAPALAQADVAVAMNAGTHAARQAANMVDMDSNPAKLLDIVEIGKQILITRGALTTFSVANGVSKYFTILPAIFIAEYPMLNVLNIMHLATPGSAILAAIMFDALIIPALIPLALSGVKYTYTTAEGLLRRNLLIYGLGGLVAPFIGIKLIDMLLVWLHLD